MSHTTTNTGDGNTSRNKKSARDGRDQGGFGGQGHSGCSSNRGNSSIAKYLFEGKMKDGCLSKLTITESANRAIQYKKITYTLPVYCTDKGYR